VGLGSFDVGADSELVGADVVGAIGVCVGTGEVRGWDADGTALGVVMTPMIVGAGAMGSGRMRT
jgi:hypothetical protein